MISFNKNLLQMKVMYFFCYAGLSPLTAFGPTFAKQLGFSASSIGFVYFVSIVLSIFGRLILGYLADKLRLHKALLILTTLLCSFSILSIAFFPQPFKNDQTLPEKVYVFKENYTSFEICFANVQEWSSLKEKLDGKICTIHFEDINFNISFAIGIISNANSIFSSVHPHSENFSCVDASKTGTYRILDDGKRKETCGNISSCSIPPGDNEDQGSFEKDLISPLFWFYLGVYAVYFVMSFIMGVFMDTICFHTLDNEDGNFGNQRMFASLGWGIAALFAGVLTDCVSENEELKNYLPTFAVSFLFLAITAIMANFFKMPKISNAAATDWETVFGVLWNRKSFIFSCWCFVIGVCSAIVWQYSFLYDCFFDTNQFSSIKLNFITYFYQLELSNTITLHRVIEDISNKQEKIWVKSLQGTMVVVNTFLGDVPTYYFFDRILSKLGYVNCMTLALLLNASRLFAYSILSHPIWALFIAVLDGITFGVGYATITSFANLISTPETKTVTQAIFNSIFDGLGTSLGALCFGFVFDRYGHVNTFQFGSFLALGTACLHLLTRIHFKKRLI